MTLLVSNKKLACKNELCASLRIPLRLLRFSLNITFRLFAV